VIQVEEEVELHHRDGNHQNTQLRKAKRWADGRSREQKR
jgi:hypothetical protein